MPGMDGFTLTRTLRSDERFTEVPVILYTTSVTGLDQLFTERDALQAGESEARRGPIAFESLPAAVERRIETVVSIRRLRELQGCLATLHPIDS